MSEAYNDSTRYVLFHCQEQPFWARLTRLKKLQTCVKNISCGCTLMPHGVRNCGEKVFDVLTKIYVRRWGRLDVSEVQKASERN
jgi:hypothetical protein